MMKEQIVLKSSPKAKDAFVTLFIRKLEVVFSHPKIDSFYTMEQTISIV